MAMDHGGLHTLSVEGTRLLLDGRPFYAQGVSFFNALYNFTFNQDAAARERWLRTFRGNGINLLRVWCQWDFSPPRTFVDGAPGRTMYTDVGEVVQEHFERLDALLRQADHLAMVIEVAAFSHEKTPGTENLEIPAQERAIRELTERLRPHRNGLLQIWNEDSTHVLRHVEIAKSVDPERLVTNSPGFAGVLGDAAQNRALDVLTPHTVRHSVGRFWEEAPVQIADLLATYGKPVIDDEPARNGIVQFGGIEGGTDPAWHIAQIRAVREAGGYHTYHHDMFQRSHGVPSTPPSGIPEPDFSPFHRQVFDYLRDHPTW
jgi:hypothetical protein